MPVLMPCSVGFPYRFPLAYASGSVSEGGQSTRPWAWVARGLSPCDSSYADRPLSAYHDEFREIVTPITFETEIRHGFHNLARRLLLLR